MSPRKSVSSIDSLPEQFPYRDNGCEVSPSCLECPLPACKYDDPAAYHRQVRESRDREIVDAKSVQGKSVPQIADHFGLSQRTIHRVLERAKTNFL